MLLIEIKDLVIDLVFALMFWASAGGVFAIASCIAEWIASGAFAVVIGCLHMGHLFWRYSPKSSPPPVVSIVPPQLPGSVANVTEINEAFESSSNGSNS